MFGYDRDPGLMMVYIDEPLYKLFSDINATNNALIAQVESGTEHIKIYYPSGLKPTRKECVGRTARCGYFRWNQLLSILSRQ